MKTIAIDAMGGDNAPKAIIEGVNHSLREFSDVAIQLYGNKEKIMQYLTIHERVTIIHTDEKIDSGDKPVTAIRHKKDSSMVLAEKAVQAGGAQAVLSAGNTGALLVSSLFVIGCIKNIDRPGLMSTLPTVDGKGVDMLDLGANAENSPVHLRQYAILGSFYAEGVRGVEHPRIGLLNNGVESSKGDTLRKETYDLLSRETSINFIGNVEACHLMDGVADVVVTDGFTGNAVLKSIEGTAFTIMKQLKSFMVSGSLVEKMGVWLMKRSIRELKNSLSYLDAGGAVLFGLKAPVIKIHGSSNARTVYKTIEQIRTILETDIVGRSVKEFSGKE